MVPATMAAMLGPLEPPLLDELDPEPLPPDISVAVAPSEVTV